MFLYQKKYSHLVVDIKVTILGAKIFIKKLASRYYPKEIFIIITKNFYISIDLMWNSRIFRKKKIPKNIIKKLCH